MFEYNSSESVIIGSHGRLQLPCDDKASLKMLMLLQGECMDIGPIQAARNFHYSKSRYYQVLDAFRLHGVMGLVKNKTGPKRNYCRTPETVKLVIRAKFLDPEAGADIIASMLRQDSYSISTRSVERIISDYGLQKKNSTSHFQKQKSTK